MHIYEIYTGNERNDTPIEILKSGFSFSAAVFTPFWALYYRMWLVAAIALCINLAITYLQKDTTIFSLALIIELFFIFIFGMFASDIREWHLLNKGYNLQDIVIADSEIEAELKFLTRKNHISEILEKQHEQQNDL